MTKISDSDFLTTLTLWSPCNHSLSLPKKAVKGTQVVTKVAIVYAPVRYKEYRTWELLQKTKKFLAVLLG